MFSSIRRARLLLDFFGKRIGDYAELARFDLIQFRREMIKSIVGAALCASSGLLLLCFICVALLVTEWDTPNRVYAAWMICGGWALLSIAGAILARWLMKGATPFEHIGSEISRDLLAIKDPQDHTDDEPRSASTAIASNAL
jgi:hypothetical protein